MRPGLAICRCRCAPAARSGRSVLQSDMWAPGETSTLRGGQTPCPHSTLSQSGRVRADDERWEAQECRVEKTIAHICGRGSAATNGRSCGPEQNRCGPISSKRNTAVNVPGWGRAICGRGRRVAECGCCFPQQLLETTRKSSSESPEFRSNMIAVDSSSTVEPDDTEVGSSSTDEADEADEAANGDTSTIGSAAQCVVCKTTGLDVLAHAAHDAPSLAPR